MVPLFDNQNRLNSNMLCDRILSGRNCLFCFASGRPCFPINSPANGAKNCSGYTTEQVCHFTCSQGYDLIGSGNRTCTATKMWTGLETKCKSK